MTFFFFKFEFAGKNFIVRHLTRMLGMRQKSTSFSSFPLFFAGKSQVFQINKSSDSVKCTIKITNMFLQLPLLVLHYKSSWTEARSLAYFFCGKIQIQFFFLTPKSEQNGWRRIQPHQSPNGLKILFCNRQHLYFHSFNGIQPFEKKIC